VVVGDEVGLEAVDTVAVGGDGISDAAAHSSNDLHGDSTKLEQELGIDVAVRCPAER
jgi:hypothetical protein